MPNHYHLLLHETEDNSISKTMQALGTSYAKAINTHYNKTGHLFQDSYKKVHIQTNEQLLHLSRYIHLNPVKAGLVSSPEQWIYSSYNNYTGSRNNKSLKMDIILDQFKNEETYANFVNSNTENINIEKLTLE